MQRKKWKCGNTFHTVRPTRVPSLVKKRRVRGNGQTSSSPCSTLSEAWIHSIGYNLWHTKQIVTDVKSVESIERLYHVGEGSLATERRSTSWHWSHARAQRIWCIVSCPTCDDWRTTGLTLSTMMATPRTRRPSKHLDLILGGTDRRGCVAMSFFFVQPVRGSRRRENCTDNTSPYARIRTFSQCASHTWLHVWRKVWWVFVSLLKIIPPSVMSLLGVPSTPFSPIVLHLPPYIQHQRPLQRHQLESD